MADLGHLLQYLLITFHQKMGMNYDSLHDIDRNGYYSWRVYMTFKYYISLLTKNILVCF